MDTARLTGRPVVDDDLGFVRRIWNDDRVAPTIGGTRTDAQLNERFERWARHRNDYGFGATMFLDRTTRQPIGWGGLQHAIIGIGGRLTVGYVIAPEHWGHGYATEIATAAVAEAFDALGADQVFASVLSTNVASRNVLEKVRMSVHTEIRHSDHLEMIYVIER